MIKISTVLLLLSISFCLAKVPLRDPQHWDNWNNIDLLNRYMGGFKFGANQLTRDDYLVKLAQTIAETESAEGPMRRLWQTYPRTSDNVLAFGITLKGDTTYKQILTEDYNGILMNSLKYN
jgi:hypothetical protein